MKLKTGLLGELVVEQKLVEEGWHVVRLDGRQLAVNSDLLAISDQHRVSLQVKTSMGGGSHSHSDCLHLGNAGGFLRSKTPFFNSKSSPLKADIVVGVSYQPTGSSFFVMPVAYAEALCVRHSRYWSSVPKQDRNRRSDGFPIYISFIGGGRERRAHTNYHAKTQRDLEAFRDRWSVLREPLSRLHDPKAWPRLED